MALTQSDSNVFSVRIVSLDYYMSPPIPDIDFSYSTFQGTKVEEVPVIRIYGSTPAGQKACLHIHGAFPYLYIPCPHSVLKDAEEGNKFVHILSNALENALKHKGTNTTKRQHVHECRIVRAKKLYGYHSSDDLFVKIYLYYPHEVARTASILLDGSILNTPFQPHESHIPYLLQFLIDYNLYGMSHIHSSKFKFRPPMPDGCISKIACFDKRDMQAHGNSAVWLSSTVPGDQIWPDSASGNDLEDKTNHLVQRQSTCGLEVDASVNDILNQKEKMYTSLSQTRSEVKMVQSLLPIWEEEYERSGTPVAVYPTDQNKPTPENVLGSFISGLDYEKAYGELCEVAKTLPDNISRIGQDGKRENSFESFMSICKASALLDQSSSGNRSQEPLKCLGEESNYATLPCKSLFQENKDIVPCEKMHQLDGLKFTPDNTLSQPNSNTGHELLQNVDTEALGLLNWLASSQAAEDFNADDGIVHEAILSPLISTKSYKEALEMAHLDYESASQKECQDILDSLEGFLGSEGMMGHASDPTAVSTTSGNVIPQVDGSLDDDLGTPQEGDLDEANNTTRREKYAIRHMEKSNRTKFGCDRYSVHQVEKSSSSKVGSQSTKGKLLWGHLPFCDKPEEQEGSEPALFDSGHNELTSDSNSSSSSGTSGGRSHDAGFAIYDEKGGKMAPTSVRDLMRRKRRVRTEQSDAVIKHAEVPTCPEASMNRKFELEGCNIVPNESPIFESSRDDQDDIVKETVTRATAYRSGTCTKDVESLSANYCSPTNQKSSVSLFSNQVKRSSMHLDESFHFQKTSAEGCIDAPSGSYSYAIAGPSLPQAESIKLTEICQSRNPGTGLCYTNSIGHGIMMPDDSQCFIKACNSKLSFEFEQLTSSVPDYPNLGFRKGDSQFIDELMEEKQDTCTRNPTTPHVERLTHDVRESKGNKDDKIVHESCLHANINRHAELNSTADESQKITTCVSRECRVRLDPDCTYTDLYASEGTRGYLELTFSRKPPSSDEVDKCSEDLPGTTGHAENIPDMNYCFTASDRRCADNILPFFSRNYGSAHSYNALNDESRLVHKDPTLGVPNHFQNDGSVLYLLTHAFSPPTSKSVHQWLSEVVAGNRPNISGGDDCDELLPRCHAVDLLKPVLSNEATVEVPKAGSHVSHVESVLNEQHATGMHGNVSAVDNEGHDPSQISGPDKEGKSNPTPLSQIGFRDSAAVGGGQQLTLISMEVVAETRGDLRPDPKFDAINALSLVIQEDSSFSYEVYVLMCSNSEEPCWRNADGVSDCKLGIFKDEMHLLDQFVKIISSFDPDILMGWEIQGGSLGFLAERATHLGISLLKKISRTCAYETKYKSRNSADPKLSSDEALAGDTVSEYSVVENEWYNAHASGIYVGGRIVLNVWQLMRAELKLHMYTIEAVAQEVLRRKIPSISNRVLNQWFFSGPGRARYRCIEFVKERAKINLEIMNQLDMINRTSELARVFGIDFFSVLSRGSQFRVESMLLRLAHTQNYVAISPGNQQVASQPAMECLPLVMEPKSGFYADPVVVLDFQSLYPSMIIAYNLCYSTCMGTVVPSKAHVLGVTSYFPDPFLLKDLKQLLLTPNGIMYVPSKVRRGVLPRLLEEILSTRIMVKQAMKKLMPSQQILQRVFNARQLALKLIANVTYGYTAAGFSGRMPCAELADSIVQCGRRTLETAISFVNGNDKWKARVIYGDTDSMFVLLKGRSREEAFDIGNEIASAITRMNPNPVTLKMEKVYHPCFLLTKKRYVGYSYESPDQQKPTFDAKGIETVRRDTCPAVAKTLERSIRLMFENQDASVVKSYLQRQWKRILSGKVSLQDFVFAKEVRLGTYSTRASSLPPAAIVAVKAMEADPRARPLYGERIPYVVIHGEPGARLVDMVVDPYALLDINSPFRLNDLYYINKQIIPALQRVFGLVGGDLHQWFSELPRLVRPTLAKCHSYASLAESYEGDYGSRPESSKMAQAKRRRIDTYYASQHCTLCGELVQSSSYLCDKCSEKESLFVTSVVGKASKLEREIQHLASICRHCGGGDWIIESGVKCTSLACSVFYERRKVQKELQAISSFATAAGLYPRCMAEWF